MLSAAVVIGALRVKSNKPRVNVRLLGTTNIQLGRPILTPFYGCRIENKVSPFRGHNANSAEPVQMPHTVAPDQDLHCLLIGISMQSMVKVKISTRNPSNCNPLNCKWTHLKEKDGQVHWSSTDQYSGRRKPLNVWEEQSLALTL